jgi:hypothetical protein
MSKSLTANANVAPLSLETDNPMLHVLPLKSYVTSTSHVPPCIINFTFDTSGAPNTVREHITNAQQANASARVPCLTKPEHTSASPYCRRGLSLLGIHAARGRRIHLNYTQRIAVVHIMPQTSPRADG